MSTASKARSRTGWSKLVKVSALIDKDIEKQIMLAGFQLVMALG